MIKKAAIKAWKEAAVFFYKIITYVHTYKANQLDNCAERFIVKLSDSVLS